MKWIYLIRGWICRIFMQFELVATTLVKFGIYFYVFREITTWEGLGEMGILGATSVHMLLALLCVLLPARFVAFFALALVVYNIFQVSFWGAVMAGVVLLVLYVMIARLCPDEAVLMIILPLALEHELFMVIPLFAGIYMGVFSIIPLVGGVLIWGFMQIIPAFTAFNVTAIDQLPVAMSDMVTYITDQLLKNENLIVLMIVCAGVVLIVYLLNKLSVNYMRYISLVMGALVGFVCFLVGNMAVLTDVSMGDALTIPLFSLLIMLVVEFFHMALNYQMAQRLAFADDEYYYYVRAIPKILGIKSKTEVKTITTVRTHSQPIVAETVVPEEDDVKIVPIQEGQERDDVNAMMLPGEEELAEKMDKKAQQATQKVSSLFQQLGNKAKGALNQAGNKRPVKKEKPVAKEEEAIELEDWKPEETVMPENRAGDVFDKTVPGKESAEELAKRTGWSEETIKGFFAGLDLDATEAGKKDSGNK